MIKSGIKSTEFWITLFSQVVGILTLAGVVVPAQSPILLQEIATIVGGIATIVPAVVYIYNRTWLKSKTLPQ